MSQKVDRARVLAVLKCVLMQDVQDHNLVMCLYSACAYVFAHPDKIDECDADLLRKAYIQLEVEGYL